MIATHRIRIHSKYSISDNATVRDAIEDTFKTSSSTSSLCLSRDVSSQRPAWYRFSRGKSVDDSSSCKDCLLEKENTQRAHRKVCHFQERSTVYCVKLSSIIPTTILIPWVLKSVVRKMSPISVSFVFYITQLMIRMITAITLRSTIQCREELQRDVQWVSFTRLCEHVLIITFHLNITRREEFLRTFQFLNRVLPKLFAEK